MRNPYFRLTDRLPRRIPAERYPMLRGKIGYLCECGGVVCHHTYAPSEEGCRDGELLRLPPATPSSVYRTEFCYRIARGDRLRFTAVYLNPYAGDYLIVGDQSLYEESGAVFGIRGSTEFCADDPLTFNEEQYGGYLDPEKTLLSFDDYFVTDIFGDCIAECMTSPSWEHPHAAAIALRFFDHYQEQLFAPQGFSSLTAPDRTTWVLAQVLRNRNAELLSQLLILHPEVRTRFRMSLREPDKFSVSPSAEMPAVTPPEMVLGIPKLYNLVQYAILFSDSNTLAVLLDNYPHDMEFRSLLQHPMYVSAILRKVGWGDDGSLAVLLNAGLSPDCADARGRHISLLSATVVARKPALTALVVSKGADILKTDLDDKTAADYAIEENVPACLSILLHALPQEEKANTVKELSARLNIDADTLALAAVLRNFSQGLPKEKSE